MNILQKNNKKLDNIFIGIITGITLPALVYIIVWYFADTGDASLATYFEAQKKGRILTHIVSLCTLPILAPFFFFLKKNNYKTVKGILIAVFAIAIWVTIVKLNL